MEFSLLEARNVKKLDRLSFNERVKHAATHAATLDLDELWREHPFLCLVAARHSGRPERILAALLDPRVSVTQPALALLRTLEPLPDLTDIFPQVCAAVRSGLLSIASTRATPSQAAALLPLAQEHEAVHLLRALSPEDLAIHLPRLAHRLSNWAGLARRHPDAVLGWLRTTLEGLPDRERASFWGRYRPCYRPLAELRPGELLRLAADSHPPESLPPIPLSLLAKSHPDEVQELLLRGQYGEPAHLRRLGRERLLRLARHVAHDPGRLASLLAGVPPGWRADLFEAAYGESDTSARVWPTALLEVLPHALRVREAERMLALRSSEVSPEVALKIVVYASPESAERLLEPESKAALAEERGRGVAAWIKNTALNRGDLAALLKRLVPRLRNEQDPVRAAACAALQATPPTRFTPETLEPLGQLVSAVTQARDTSWATRTSLQQLGMALLRRGALEPGGPLLGFSLDLQRKLVNQSGALAWPRLADLPKGSEQALFEALQQWVRSANERDAYGPVLSLARALGKRARGVAGLQKLVEEATRVKPDWVAMMAIQVWLEDPSSRDQRVRALVDKDESTITIGPVFEHLHRRRQDWLDPFLEPRFLKGRFGSNKTRYLLPARDGFHRWLPRQQRVFANAMIGVARDTQRSDFERNDTIRRLARIPVTGLADLKDFLNNTHVPTLESGLAAATHLDRPAEALPILLEHLDGDQARVAMYAVPRVARFTPPSVLAKTLRELLGREKLKVTVHKEVLRLLGAHRVPGAAEMLQDQWARPELHRDVRIALLHAARALGEWPLLELAAHHEDGAVARSLLDENPLLLSREARRRYAALVMAVAFHADARAREAAFLGLPRWAAGLEDEVARVLSRGVLDLSLGPEWKAAAAGLVSVVRDGQAQDVLQETAAGLTDLPRDPDAGGERDLPGVQRWLYLEDLIARVEWRKRKALSLGSMPGLALHVAALRWPGLEGVEQLAGTRIPDLVLTAFDRELADPGFVWEGVEQSCERLLAGNPLLRRMAVRLVAAAGARAGWTPQWRDRLRALRADQDPIVRWEAGRRFTVAE